MYYVTFSFILPYARRLSRKTGLEVAWEVNVPLYNLFNFSGNSRKFPVVAFDKIPRIVIIIRQMNAGKCMIQAGPLVRHQRFPLQTPYHVGARYRASVSSAQDSGSETGYRITLAVGYERKVKDNRGTPRSHKRK